MQPFAGPSRPRSTPLSSPTLSPTHSVLSVAPLALSASQNKPLKSQIPGLPRRLLVPTSVPKCPSPPAQQLPSRPGSALGRSASHAHTHAHGKPSRSRANSAPPEPAQDALSGVHRWFDFESNFEVVEDRLQLVGYQIYAVEKWIVDRNRSTVLLSVYTGDPKDKITVMALAPLSTLPEADQHHEWERAMHELRRDNARPRETDKGVIMVTSLANFRSDYTVVHIPDGDFLAHREQLYVNINLLRVGCGGRMALTLQPPSDTSKDRFLSQYQFKENHRADEQFRATVIAFVKIIQSALSLFEFFPVDAKEQNGLMCDLTVEGLQKWVNEIGVPYMKVEAPTTIEKLADPPIISALISLVISMRNKLNAMSFSAPKDPFFYPRRFTRTLAVFVNQRLAHHPVSANSPASSTSAPQLSGAPVFCHHAYLNLTLMQRIDLVFEKHRASDAYKLHRVVLNKLDDITTTATTAIATASSKSGLGHAHTHSLTLSTKERDAEALMEGTADLPAFVAKVTALAPLTTRAGKDVGAPSVKYLWTGKLDQLERKRVEGVLSDAEEERERERERSDFSDEDGENPFRMPWSNKVQRKLEGWAGREFGRSRKKSSSVDLSIKDKSPEKGRGHSRGRSASTAQLPSVVISRDPDDPASGFSSGQASPISPSPSLIALGGFPSAHNSALAVDDAEYFRRVAQFNQIRPSLNITRRLAITSWSDPVSAEELLDDLDLETARQPGFPGFGMHQYGLGMMYSSAAPAVGEQPSKGSRGESGSEEERRERRRRRDPLRTKLKRSLSFEDKEFRRFEQCLSMERMRTDVDLAAQCLIMYRRRFHIEAVIATLKTLLQLTSDTNDVLREYHEGHAELIQDLVGKSQIVADIEEAVSQAESAAAETEALLYEANFLDVHTLWRMAQGPRRRVFAIRDRVFGSGSGRGGGASGFGTGSRAATAASARGKRYPAASHGRFNRVQRRLDGRERLVDFLGRTESEVEEESELPEIMPDGADSEGDGEEDEDEDADAVERHLSAGAEAAEEGQLKAFSTWLLTLFTKWGRVLGVGGAAAATAATAPIVVSSYGFEESAEPKDGMVDEYYDADAVPNDQEKPKARLGSTGIGRTRGNGHGHGHNRLSTVGEEEEEADTASQFEEPSSPEIHASASDSGGGIESSS